MKPVARRAKLAEEEGWTIMKAKIRWKTKEEGGRKAPPAGCAEAGVHPYTTMMNFRDPPDATPQEVDWSLVVEEVEILHEYEWIADVYFLVKEAPAAELQPGRKFALYEGWRCVATGVVLEEEPTMIIPPTTIECVNQLLKQVPELQSAYDEHLRNNDELLPHVFLGDVTRYVVRQVRSGETGLASPVERILGVLEQCMASGEEYVTELVAVSFIENLYGEDDVVKKLKGLIGPHLEKEIKIHGQ